MSTQRSTWIRPPCRPAGTGHAPRDARAAAPERSVRRRIGRLLVEREAQGVVAMPVLARHHAGEGRLIALSMCGRHADERGAVRAAANEADLADVVGPPMRRLLERLDDGLAIHDRPVGQHRQRVTRHQGAVEPCDPLLSHSESQRWRSILTRVAFRSSSLMPRGMLANLAPDAHRRQRRKPNPPAARLVFSSSARSARPSACDT